MKKMLKIVGIVAVAAICFSMIACDDSGDDGWISEGGTLTLTGLANYNEKFIIARKGSTFYAGDSYKGSLVRGSAISGGISVLNAWEVIERGQFITYSNTEVISNIEILIMAHHEYDMATLGQQLAQYITGNPAMMTQEQKDGLKAIGVEALGYATVQFTNGTGEAPVTPIIQIDN